MAGVKIVSHKAEDIYEDQKRLRSIMKGEIPGFISETPSNKDRSADGKAFKNPATGAHKYAKAAYDFAAMRDAFYCIAGRKYMRRMAVAGKMISDLRRATALYQIEAERKDEK